LQNPIKVPALGMDDEMVKILDVQKKHYELQNLEETDKVVFLEEIKDFKFVPASGQFFQAPKLNTINKTWKL
jgi:hypothetical protein